ncbi:MAG: hypothetical protein M0004_06385 [Actinomycetota bacterium]|nr:hypothetical protein [Actinomycetota bacterium]
MSAFGSDIARLPSPACRGPVAAVTAPWRRLCVGDRAALAVLILLPVLIQVPFALAGHPLIQGDNLTQNFPLRSLTGEELAAGHLPSWNSLIWSGTPLLAGWNAGSMFPGTWLFAVLPHLAAWCLNALVAPIAAATGTFVFLRARRLGPLAAAIGGFAFAWTGFMSGQSVHIGLVQGASFLPWSLVAMEALARRRGEGARPRAYAAGVLGLGASFSLTVLAGDPRAVSSSAVVLVVATLACCYRLGRRCGRFLAAVVAAGVLAVACSAMQWVPGLSFLRSSQRGQAAYAFFGSGSLSPAHLLMQLALPFADGGNGNFGLPYYQGTYNMPEITIGVGVLALVAFAAFLPSLVAAIGAWLRRLGQRRAPATGAPAVPERDLGFAYALVIVGALMTLGNTTPLGHLFVHIPLFGSERLQNRNAEIMDLGLVILLALLVDELTGVPSALRRRERRSVFDVRGARPLGVAVLAAIVGFGIFVAAAPITAQHDYGVSGATPSLPLHLLPYFCWELLVIAGAGALLFGWRRLGERRLRRVLLATCALDLGAFVLMASYATIPSAVLSGPNPQSRAVHRLAGFQGRFALYDPSHANPTADSGELLQLGASDLNILQHSPSVQGYGSIVDDTYAAATSTHTYEDLRVARLSGETFNTLDLSALVTTPLELATPLSPPGGGASAAPGAPSTTSARTFALAAHGSDYFELGNPTALRAITITLSPPGGTLAQHAGALSPRADPLPARLTVRERLAAGGTRTRTVAVHGDTVQLAPGTSRRLVGLSVANPGHLRTSIDALVVTTSGSPAERLVLDGPLQGHLAPPHWVWRAALGDFVIYANTETRGLAWLQPPHYHTPDTRARAAGSVHTVLSSVLVPEQMVVDSPHPALLVRAETYEPGWTARLTPLGGGPTRVLTVHRFGLVQVVDLPAGHWKLRWRYAPRSLLEGLVGSILGTIACAGLVLAVLAERRARRGRGEAGAPGHPLRARAKTARRQITGPRMQVPTS